MQPFKDHYLCFVEGKVHISSVSKYSFHSLFFCVSYWATTLVHMLVSAFNLCSPSYVIWIPIHLSPREIEILKILVLIHNPAYNSSVCFKFHCLYKGLKKCYSYDGGELSIDFVSQHQHSFPLAQFEASTDMWFLIKL